MNPISSKKKRTRAAPSRRSVTNATAPATDLSGDAMRFRRGRTMTDRSSVPEVSERAKLHYIRRLRRKLLLLLAIIVVAVVIIYGCLLQLSIHINVTATNAPVQAIDSAKYEKLFESYFARYPFERFRFAVNSERLLSHLQARAPEVARVVSAQSDGPAVSRYQLEFRQPVAGWTAGDERYYVDAGGVTFRQNYYDEPTVSVVDNSGAQVATGEAIVSSRLLSFAGRIVALSTSGNIAIDHIEIPEGAMRRIVIHITGRPAVSMTIDRAEQAQFDDTLAAFGYLDGKGESATYIDVRVPGRTYYH